MAALRLLALLKHNILGGGMRGYHGGGGCGDTMGGGGGLGNHSAGASVPIFPYAFFRGTLISKPCKSPNPLGRLQSGTEGSRRGPVEIPTAYCSCPASLSVPQTSSASHGSGPSEYTCVLLHYGFV